MTRTEQSGRGQHHSRTRHALCARVYLIKLVLHFSMVKALVPLTSCLSVVGGICSEPSPPPRLESLQPRLQMQVAKEGKSIERLVEILLDLKHVARSFSQFDHKVLRLLQEIVESIGSSVAVSLVQSTSQVRSHTSENISLLLLFKLL